MRYPDPIAKGMKVSKGMQDVITWLPWMDYILLHIMLPWNPWIHVGFKVGVGVG